MRKLLSFIFISLFLLQPAWAQTLIPEAFGPGVSDEEIRAREIAPGCGDLGAKFQTGDFEIADIPCYAVYLTELIIYFAGVLAVFFVVIGGYQYVSSGAIEENRENAKKTIMFAVGGLILVVLAWTVINIWQVFLTGG